MNLKKHLLTALVLSFTLTACSDPDTAPNSTNNSNNTPDTSLQDTSLQDTNIPQDTNILQDTNTPQDTTDTPDAQIPPPTPELTGTLDPTFAANSPTPGLFTGPAHTRFDGSALTIAPSGDLFVTGRGRLTPPEEPQPADFPKQFTLNLDNTGQPVPTFGQNGLATLPLGPESQDITVLAAQRQSDNKIVTCGNIKGTEMGRAHLTVTRLNPDGSPDPTFGNTHPSLQNLPGIAYFDVPTDKPNALCWALHMLDDGKILVAGQIGANSTMIPLLMRLNPDGSLDETFGNTSETPGIILHDIDPDNIWLYAQIREFNVLPNNKILALIHSQNLQTAHNNGYLLRFNPDGTVDTTFGTDGLITLALPQNASHEAIDFAINPDTQHIFITGRTFTADPDLPFLAFVHALLPNGQTDPDFPTFIHPDLHAATRAVLIQTDGKIIAAGSSITHQNSAFEAGDLLAIRLTPDGQLDPDFAPDSSTPGVFTHEDSTHLFYTARAQLDSQNRLIITGSTPIDDTQSPRGHTFVTRLK